MGDEFPGQCGRQTIGKEEVERNQFNPYPASLAQQGRSKIHYSFKSVLDMLGHERV